MVKVTDQDQYHPLLPTLEQWVDVRGEITRGIVRGGKPARKRRTLSPKLKISQAILRHSVERWQALSEEEKQWWRDNCPAFCRDGYHYFMWHDMIQDYGGGPWLTEDSEVHGHAYIVPDAAKEGVVSIAYCGATILGSKSILAKGVPTLEEFEELKRPILLVHGWYKDPFDPYETWKAMTQALTGQDPTKEPDYVVVYSPNHPGDEAYALRKCAGQGRLVYISNYSRDSSQGTSGDIREYAYELEADIELANYDAEYHELDIVAHSMGCLVSRAYIEAEDLSDPPCPTTYHGDIRKLIMLGPPNQGSYLADIWPDLAGWTSLNQMEHGSAFLTELNAGTTGALEGVEYSIVAGNYYKCRKFPKFASALLICALAGGGENDGAIDVQETQLASQGIYTEVPARRWWIVDVDHTHLRGAWDQPVYTADLIKDILQAEPEPPEQTVLEKALECLKGTTAGRPSWQTIQDDDVIIIIQDLPEDVHGMYGRSANTITISTEVADLGYKQTADILAHEGLHVLWKADNSISEEWHAWVRQGNVWTEIKGAVEWLDGELAEWIAGLPKNVGKIHMRQTYPTLPEFGSVTEDLWEGFALCEDADAGNEPAIHVQIHAITVEFGELPEDWRGCYLDSLKKIVINEDQADEPPQEHAALIAHEGTHAVWDRCNSIDQEYHCFFAQAMVWKEVRGELTDDWLDAILDAILVGEEFFKDYLRSLPGYDDLPEECPPLPPFDTAMLWLSETTAGNYLYTYLIDNDIGISWPQPGDPGISHWNSEEQRIVIAPGLIDFPLAHIVANLAHEGYHAYVDVCNSIEQEYQAHKVQSAVWEEVKNGLINEYYENLAAWMAQDPEVFKDILRASAQYGYLPEYCP